MKRMVNPRNPMLFTLVVSASKAPEARHIDSMMQSLLGFRDLGRRAIPPKKMMCDERPFWFQIYYTEAESVPNAASPDLEISDLGQVSGCIFFTEGVLEEQTGYQLPESDKIRMRKLQ